MFRQVGQARVLKAQAKAIVTESRKWRQPVSNKDFSPWGQASLEERLDAGSSGLFPMSCGNEAILRLGI